MENINTQDVEVVIEYLKAAGEHQKKRTVEQLLSILLNQSTKIIELEMKLEEKETTNVEHYKKRK